VWSFIKDNDIRSILDVGCGNGNFLNNVDSGIKRIGIEPNKDAAKKSKHKVYETYEDFMSTLPSTDNVVYIDGKNDHRYDMITMFGVLEHLKNPTIELIKYMQLLKPNGYFACIVPNVDSLIVKTLGEQCSTFCPQHLWYYNISTLSEMLCIQRLSLGQYTTIEPETQPILRHLRGFKPYCNINIELTDHDISDKSIIDNKMGYKICAIYKKEENE
jgi:SAM-dependent methyltransferase